jgi:hypothetical protein
MRRLYMLFVMIAAAALSAQTQTAETQSTQTQTVTEATQPPQQPSLVHTAEVQPGDSPLVQAAKRALAKRQNAKNRLTVVPGSGHISQGTIPLKPLVLPPEPKSSTRPGIDPNINRRKAEDIERRIRILESEQKRLGAEADEVVGGDVDEDAVGKRLTDLQEKIDELRLQLKQIPPPPQR